MTQTPDEAALLAQYDSARAPQHVAIIMDGNGRWAQQRGLPRVAGHRAGAESVRAVIEACPPLGIRYLTLYTFSAENWKRPAREVDALMQLIDRNLRQEAEELHAMGARVRVIGRQHELPDFLQATLRQMGEFTAGNDRVQVILAINYGGRAEITDACQALAAAAVAGELDPTAIDEQAVAARLYAPDVPDPDLLIRTAGEQRISNYLLWQAAYAELCFLPVLWPDFRRPHLLQALVEYQNRQRKFGGLPAGS